MLDILAELLIELLGGDKAKKKTGTPRGKPPPPARPAVPGSKPDEWPQRQSWPEPSADDPYKKGGHPGDDWKGLSLEDLVKRMAGRDDPPAEAQPSRRQRPQAAPQRQAQQAPEPQRPRPQPVKRQVGLSAEQLQAFEPAAPEKKAAAPAVETGTAADIAARLRNNPQAARDAFVFAEIFGRPLGERDGY